MPTIEINGCRTRYETVGRGPALLMFSPGGFDSSLENWTSFGRYRNLGLIDALSPHYTCVVFDRRESGRSSGRLERLTWEKYVTQAVGLLDHLGIGRARHGGCVGCSSAAALAVAHPGRVASMVLSSPAAATPTARPSSAGSSTTSASSSSTGSRQSSIWPAEAAPASARTRASAPGRRRCGATTRSPRRTRRRTSTATSRSSPEPAVCSSTATPCPVWSRRTSACSRCRP